VSDIDTVVVVESLKALDLKRSIREADIGGLRSLRFATKLRPVVW